ncbi:MAG: site-2 protease family protein [Gemmataceae bacterium]|nr:site-2 protease family protein [Gemmataceae bacterium]MDW8267069.1 site-2 protease family protein [Gemmataceae bacterium]
MQFLDPDATPYDLRFRLFDVPVRVHPTFWLVTAILGWRAFEQHGFGSWVLWIGCVFVSILVHEMGHVLVGRAFGAFGHIVMYGFGGFAIGSSKLPDRWQRLTVYLAGPAAQFALFALVLTGDGLLGPPAASAAAEWWQMAMAYLFIVNLFWAAMNLLPIWPLDGGQISRELCTWLMPWSGLRVSLAVSLVLAILVGLAAWRYLGSVFMLLFFGLLAYDSFQMLQHAPPPPSSDDGPWTYRQRPPWE